MERPSITMPSDDEIRRAAAEVVDICGVYSSIGVFTDGEGNLAVIGGGGRLEGWIGLGNVSAVSKTIAVREIIDRLNEIQ